MNSPIKKRAGDDNAHERRGKRQATTPPRLTRAMLRKLNENGGPRVELNPGLDMRIRRRSPGTRPPKRAAQDEAFGSSVKGISKTRKKRRGAKPQPKKSQLVESRPTEPQITEPQSTEPQPTEPQPIEPQPTEQQFIQVSPTDQEKMISEADVAAASRLAQAAIAAGLTGTASEAGSPVVEDLPDLVRFTSEDLRTVLSETVTEDAIRRRMEPHWLARMEFLTWLERPAADMHRIKGEISRLAARWSRDLRNQDNLGVDIPISTLESWRADITIVSDPGQDAGSSEARNEGGNTSDEKKGAEKDEGEKEGCEEGSDTEVDRTQAAQEVRDETEGDEEVLSQDRREVIEAITESVTLTARDMVEWKEAFDKEMTAEPNFRSKRAWVARVSESQKEAQMLEKKAWNLDVHKPEMVTKSAVQAVEQLLDELQKFRIGLRMDREAFWDEFDQEGAEILPEKTGIDPSAEGEVQEAVEELQEAAEELQKAAEEVQEAAEEVQEAVQEVQEAVQEGEARVSVKIKIQMTDFEAEVEEAPMAESENLQGSSTGSDGVVGVKKDPTEEPFGEENNENDSNPTTVLPEQPSVEATTPEASLPVHNEETTPPFPSRAADPKSESDIAKAQERNSRSPDDTYAGRGITSPRKEETSVAQSAAKIEHQDQEQAAEAGERLDSRESTPWLPDKRGSHSPSWRWPPGEGHQEVEAKVNDYEIAAAPEKDEGPQREAGRDTSSELFSSRSASAEEFSNEEENRAEHAMNTSDGNGTPQEPSSISSSTQLKGPCGGNVKIEDTADQALAASHTVHSQEQDTNSVTSISQAVSPDKIIGEAHNSAGSPSNASLPEDSSSSSSGGSEAGEDVEGPNITQWCPAVPRVPQDTSLSQDIDPSTEGVGIESPEENRGGTEDTVDSNSSTSNIAKLLEEVSLPQDTSSSTTGVPSGSVEGSGGEPKEEEEEAAADQTLSTDLPQATSPTASGIRSDSETGAGSEAGNTAEDHAETISDTASPAQGSRVVEDPGVPPAVSAGESPVVVPNVRYIKPQWESLFSPEEPTYTANDYSANEIDDGDGQDDEFDEVDDRETDDVDP